MSDASRPDPDDTDDTAALGYAETPGTADTPVDVLATGDLTDRTDLAAFPDIAGLSYEDAREELVGIVSRLEAGQAPLEDSMHLWRRGEALAAHCSRWLEGARAEIDSATRADT